MLSLTLPQNLLDTLISPQELYPLLDLTCLNESAAPAEIQTLIHTGSRQKVPAICVYPQYLNLIPRSIARVSVINFPSGNQALNTTIQELTNLLPNVDEVDYVFNYQKYLNGAPQQALDECAHIYDICLQHHKTFKVIIETGAIPSIDQVYAVSRAILNHGCDFLKTSTGKIKIGATIPAAFAMLTAIADSNMQCGIKFSGGIKTLKSASEFINLAQNVLQKSADASWLRIGTSTTVWN